MVPTAALAPVRKHFAKTIDRLALPCAHLVRMNLVLRGDFLKRPVREEVESLAKADEKWTVTDNPRISVTLHSPKNPSQGRGFEINASNYDDLASVMESLRAEWEARGQEDDEYENALLERFRS